MAEKTSVVKIDIQDGKWKAFIAEFAKFRGDNKEAAQEAAQTAERTAQIAVEKRKILEEQARLNKMTKEERAEAEAEMQARQKVLASEQKKTAEQAKQRETAKKERAETMKGLRDSVKWTADIARNVASTAYSGAKWVALSAVASGFGLGGLASNAASVRRQSQGLGVNTGELRAANVNFSKYIDPESALSNIANTKDSNDRWVFNRVGLNTNGKNSAQILAEYLPKVVSAFKSVGGNTSVAEATGLTKIVGIEDLRRLSSLNEKELADTIAAYKKDRASLLDGDDVDRSWQEFLVSLHRASQQIEVSLLRGLTKLTPYLQQFADGIAKAINSFVSSGGLQRWIETVGAGLQKLGAYLGSKEFEDDVKSFMRAVGSMAKWLNHLFGDNPDKDFQHYTSNVSTALTGSSTDDLEAAFDEVDRKNALKGSTLSERNHNPGNLRAPGSSTQFQTFANDNEGLRAMARQLQLYENRDRLLTIRQIISKYAPGSENNTAAYISNVAQRTGFGPDQKLDPQNLDQLVKLIVAMTKQENGRSNFSESGVKIVIQNQTGGSAQASIAALAQ